MAQGEQVALRRADELGGHDRRAVTGLFDATSRLVFSWTARPVTREHAERAGVPLDPVAYMVLRHIRVHGPLRLGELASLASMTASNASKVVTDLVADGFVSRRVPTDDRRVTLLELTPTGLEATTRLEQVGSEMLGERLAPFSAEEVDDLLRLLTRLADAVETWCTTLRRDGGGTAAGTEEES